MLLLVVVVPNGLLPAVGVGGAGRERNPLNVSSGALPKNGNLSLLVGLGVRPGSLAVAVVPRGAEATAQTDADADESARKQDGGQNNDDLLGGVETCRSWRRRRRRGRGPGRLVGIRVGRQRAGRRKGGRTRRTVRRWGRRRRTVTLAEKSGHSGDKDGVGKGGGLVQEEREQETEQVEKERGSVADGRSPGDHGAVWGRGGASEREGGREGGRESGDGR